MSEQSRAVGRPSKYTAEMQSKADAYVRDYGIAGDVIPSRAGLCCYLGIARSTLYEWEAQFAEFSDTLGAVDVLQENRLLNGGLAGSFNPTITKLLLHSHGHSDKLVTDHTSTDGSMSPKGATLADFYADVQTKSKS